MQPPPTATAARPGPRESDQAAPRTYLGDAPLHWALLAISAAVLLLALVLRVHGEDRVAVPLGVGTLPEVCSYKLLFDSDCPGCGLTRCFISLAHGNVVRAWKFNPAGVYLFLVVLFQVPYRSLQLWRMRRGQRELNLGRLSGIALGVLVAALLIQWAVRLLGVGS